MTRAPWPRSTLPADRDDRWNHMEDANCILYREFEPGDVITGFSVTVQNQGETVLYGLTRGDPEVQRIVVTDDAALQQALAEALAVGTADATVEEAAG